MSYQNQGGYYGLNAAGAPYDLTQNLLLTMLLNPQIRGLLQSGATPPDTNQLSGLMSWANSQANSSRAIAPTIPGLRLPASIQQIISQKSPLSQIASQLNPGGPPPSTGQFASSGQIATSPTSTAPASSTAQAPTSQAPSSGPLSVDEIVAKAVAAALGRSNVAASEGSGGGSGSSSGPEAPSGGGVGSGGLDRSIGSPDIGSRGV